MAEVSGYRGHDQPFSQASERVARVAKLTDTACLVEKVFGMKRNVAAIGADSASDGGLRPTFRSIGKGLSKGGESAYSYSH